MHPQGIAGRPLNVLIVEDSVEDAERAVLELRRAGYAPDYRRVATAREMSAALDERPWDLVLCAHSLSDFTYEGALALVREKRIPAPASIPLGAGQFLMTTLRSHDQCNTTIYGLDDRYRGIFHGCRVVLMNPDAMQENGWEAGQPLDITSHFRNDGKQELRRAHVSSYYLTRFPDAVEPPISPRRRNSCRSAAWR